MLWRYSEKSYSRKPPDAKETEKACTILKITSVKIRMLCQARNSEWIFLRWLKEGVLRQVGGYYLEEGQG